MGTRRATSPGCSACDRGTPTTTLTWLSCAISSPAAKPAQITRAEDYALSPRLRGVLVTDGPGPDAARRCWRAGCAGCARRRPRPTTRVMTTRPSPRPIGGGWAVRRFPFAAALTRGLCAAGAATGPVTSTPAGSQHRRRPRGGFA